MDGGPPRKLGAVVGDGRVQFTVRSATAQRLTICLFDEAGDEETGRVDMERLGDGLFGVDVAGIGEGARYGLRADGDYRPEEGLWFDPDKLLVDPYAAAIDRPYVYDARLSARRGEGGDTAALVPKAVVARLPEAQFAPPLFRPGGLIYELQVKSFTKRHPDVPEGQRGTLAALAHPSIVAHLKALCIDAVELMPLAAWIDERHLPPLGLANAWGYNPVTFMALDPRLAPGGMAELRDVTAVLREAGIGVILDVVFNHTGEGDALGPTLSLRGIDNPAYYRHQPDNPGILVNDTGCGNTLACDRPAVRDLVLDALRHFVRYAGVDGFRFDLAPVLGRGPDGFSRSAAIFAALDEDPLLRDRVMIAEPWDVGPNGYQLGNFPQRFLEWNDKSRDDIRRFWRGDAGMIGALATRLAGSSDVFGHYGAPGTRTVNFVAAHDGMTLADVTAFEHKHNEGNGEQNRDGHDENFSWNCGVEGRTEDAGIAERRRNDIAAMLSTLFATRGALLLTAGDEFGRTQRGNNNAYAQDNELAWLDWRGADGGLYRHACFLGRLRRSFGALRDISFLNGHPREGEEIGDVEWLSEAAVPLSAAEWNDRSRHALAMVLRCPPDEPATRLAVLFNGHDHPRAFTFRARPAHIWRLVGADAAEPPELEIGGLLSVPERSVAFVAEFPA